MVLTSGRPCRSIQHQGAKRALADLYDLLSAETPSQGIRDAQSNTDLRKLLLRQPGAISCLQGRSKWQTSSSTARAACSVPSSTTRVSIPTPSPSSSAGAGPTNFTDYQLAGSQPATRMTYWLAAGRQRLQQLSARTPPARARLDNFQPVTPAQTGRDPHGVRPRLFLHSAHLRSRLVVRHRGPALCPEHGASRVLDRRLSAGARPTKATPTDLGAGDAWLAGNANVASNYFGTDEFSTIIHEFGHTLGLKHGHETTPNGALAREFDNHEFSVMTYRTYTGSPFDPIGKEVDGSSPQSYMMFDISALQSMYGANFSRLGKADTYRWNGTYRPADDQRRAGAQHRPQLHRQDLLDHVDAGRRSDLRPQRLQPGPGRRPQARPLADLLQRPARRPQPRQPVGRSSRPRATSTTRCSTTATCRSAIANLTTGIGNDTLIGNDRDNVLSAGAGTDIILTSGGNDIGERRRCRRHDPLRPGLLDPARQRGRPQW